MAEVVGVDAARTDDPPLPELVEHLDELLLAARARARQHVEGERASDGGGKARELLRGGGELGQPRLEDGLGAGRQLPAPVDEPGPHPLADEQRVALGLAVDELTARGIELAARDAAGQCFGLVAVQRTQLELDRLAARSGRAQQRMHRVLGAELLGARRRDDEQRRPRLRAQQVVQPAERLGVAPLHVVDREQQRPALCDDGARQRVQQPRAFPVRGQRRRGRELGPLGEQLGQEPCELTSHGSPSRRSPAPIDSERSSSTIGA